MMQHFISAPEKETIEQLLESASQYKADPVKDKLLGKGLRVGLLFMNPSLRTRVSTQIAAQNLGMECIVLNMDKDNWRMETENGAIMNGSSVEHIKDAAGVLGCYFDILCVRSFPSLIDKEADGSDTLLQSLIRHSGKPIVSLESTLLHPLQSLADLLTIKERTPAGKKPKVVLSWAPHIKPIPHCVAHSFAQWMSGMGNEIDFTITHPRGYELAPEFIGKTPINYNRQEALRDADFVYVKNWCSYNDYGQTPTVNEDWLLREKDMQAANAQHIMHCLPVRRNVELSDELLDGNRSLVQQQAANRIWAAQSVLAHLIKTRND